ncbi:glycerol-3-phosphate dehydrogenase [Motilibacter rhizosphaerae]|uniref:Glycerol-3-phosphate dehydrogenase n=1 Tax=Motilibacter rhizosphaerae TaxID=598652 RepID=A0A4Q7NXY9_9ACTN|nr:glycerol-3-phosphate dehydrogenase/oxidase [Motilibacter rhizosphaerae]RZS91252.1 glycerol-3-phosphate dehydrogenase [Motilibacter rhizosphaerae]
MASRPLGPQYRQDATSTLRSTELDVLVVGGGVTGAGVALDAVTRGLRVGLVEARDFAAGTSSRSSKLIHGGLRYLEQKDFTLVHEALRERSLMLRSLAPHLVRPVPFLLPLQHRVWERGYIGAGVTLYDVMAGLGGSRVVPHHKQLTRRGALKLAPGLRPDALVGAIQYYDAQVDDARHTLTIARTAAEYGATLLTSARVTGYLRDRNRVVGATVKDLESGEEFAVRAKRVIAATGVWSNEVQELAGAHRSFSVKASKGVHILVRRDRIDLHSGMILRTEKSVLFVIPWGSHWIIGTTDTPYDLDKAHPAASSADIDYILDHVNAVLRSPLSREDIVGTYAGLRPLLSGDADDTAKLSREHTVAEPAPGLVIVAGGKYTTYRVMAKDAVDFATRNFRHPVPASVTETLPILGAVGYQALRNQREQLATRYGIPVERVDHLLSRYGSGIPELMDLIGGDPSLGQPLSGAPDYLRVEIAYAASHEAALHLEDVLTRRTRISVEEPDRGVAVAEEVAAILAEVLGWDAATVRREVDHYRARVEAELAASSEPDEAVAQQIRLAAGDILDRYGSAAQDAEPAKASESPAAPGVAPPAKVG